MRVGHLLLGATAKAAYAAEVLADSPTAYWRLDESSGTTMVDAMGTYDGTYYNSPTLGSTALAAGAGGTAVTLNGTNQYGLVAHNAALNASSVITIEMWVKLDNPSADALQVLIDKTAVSGANGQYAMWWDNRSSIGSPQRLRLFGGGTNRQGDWTGSAAASALAGGGHLVGVIDLAANPTHQVYWNGSLVASNYIAGTFSANTKNLGIGTYSEVGFYVDGTMDEVAIYHSALSAARIAAHYNAGA